MWCAFIFPVTAPRLAEDPNSASTRYYQAIVPYDANLVTSAQVASIAQSLPPSEINFTLVLDACHSGGMFLSPDNEGRYLGQGCGGGVPGNLLRDRTLDLSARPHRHR